MHAGELCPPRGHMVVRAALRLSVALFAGSTAVLPAAPARSAVPAHPDDKTIVHVLNRIGFGPAPGDVERIRHLGLARYIDQQLDPGSIPNADLATRLGPLLTLTWYTKQLAERYFVPAMMERRRTARLQVDGTAAPEVTTMNQRSRTPLERTLMTQEREVLSELAEQKVLRAAYSERQLEEVMVDFWFNHFNVFAGKGATRIYLTEYERDAIRPHVLGRFRDLLGATARSPAMLFYLDNWQSATAEAADEEPSARPANRGLQATARRAARTERELRSRTDGAAHARRRWRLHPA